MTHTQLAKTRRLPIVSTRSNHYYPALTVKVNANSAKTENGLSFAKMRSVPPNAIIHRVSCGKVRNIYAFNGLIFKTSNRLSVFDRVIKENVPKKGSMLNCISQYNKQQLEAKEIVQTDFLPASNFLFEAAGFKSHSYNQLSYARKLNMFPLEFIVRGYIVGSAWAAYKKGKGYCGITFPDGLHEGQKLDNPIVTPTTKASSGHDMPVTHDEAVIIIADWLRNSEYFITAKDIQNCCNDSRDAAHEMFQISLKSTDYAQYVFKQADRYVDFPSGIFSSRDLWEYYSYILCYAMAEYYVDTIYFLCLATFDELSKRCEEKGILFIDSKFEFGLDSDGIITLGDEVGTPDSSRFASKEEYDHSGKIVSMDKQIVRDYCKQIGFNGDSNQKIPKLPDSLWEKVTDTYISIAVKLCGNEVEKYLRKS